MIEDRRSLALGLAGWLAALAYIVVLLMGVRA